MAREIYTGKKVHITFYEYVLTYMFAVLGYMTAVFQYIPAKTFILGFLCLIYIYKNRRKIEDKKPLIWSVLSYVIIAFIHKAYYGMFDDRVYLELPLLILSGYYITKRLGWRFRYAMLEVMGILGAISLFFYFLMVFTGFVPSSMFDIMGYNNILIYNIRLNEIILQRNCGPYWEPGAWGGYLLITLLFFYDDLGRLLKTNRILFVIIIITILTTRSTQAYIASFMAFVLYFVKKRFQVKYLIILMILFSVSMIVYQEVPFLKEKVDDQLELTEDWESDESLQSANRFTTTMVDIYYILKSPLIGNTNDPTIRYGDHPVISNLYLYGRYYGSGSGITSQIACYGIPLFMIWLFLSYKKQEYNLGRKSAFCVMIVLLALGNGEMYSNCIFYLALPFITYKKKSCV